MFDLLFSNSRGLREKEDVRRLGKEIRPSGTLLDPSEGGKLLMKLGPDECATGLAQDDGMLCPGKP